MSQKFCCNKNDTCGSCCQRQMNTVLKGFHSSFHLLMNTVLKGFHSSFHLLMNTVLKGFHSSFHLLMNTVLKGFHSSFHLLMNTVLKGFHSSFHLLMNTVLKGFHSSFHLLMNTVLKGFHSSFHLLMNTVLKGFHSSFHLLNPLSAHFTSGICSFKAPLYSLWCREIHTNRTTQIREKKKQSWLLCAAWKQFILFDPRGRKTMKNTTLVVHVLLLASTATGKINRIPHFKKKNQLQHKATALHNILTTDSPLHRAD